MLRHLRTRRRPLYVPQICAIISAALLLFSLALLHRRLSFFTSTPHHHLHDSSSLSDPLLDDLDTTDPLSTTKSTEDRIDELDDTVSDTNTNEETIAEEEDEDSASQSTQNGAVTTSSNYYFDPVTGVVRQSFNRRSIEEWEDYVPFISKLSTDLGFADTEREVVYGSDDVLVEEKLRKRLSEVRKFEDALLLKESVLREGWGEWFEKKADFLRRDRMFKSNIEVLNPLNNPILQDPDGGGLTGMTRGDRIFLKGVLNGFKRTQFLSKKTSSISNDEEKGINVGKGAERRTLDNEYISKLRNSSESDDRLYYADGKRWGYYPGLDGRLSFGNFMDAYFRRGRCSMRVFMVWNSPAWMFGVRQQRGLESLFYHDRDACVVVFSETIELNFFSGFVKHRYKVAVAMPNLDELLNDTPVHVFASVWHDWKKTKHYPTHYSELIRLASLYKYGGTYLDSDLIVLKPVSELNNTVGFEDELAGKTLNGAVMAFRKHSPFILECLVEFYASYDDEQLRWNGADLLTRVADSFLSNKENSDTNKELLLQASSVFFPIGHNSISRYFFAPGTETEKLEQDALFSRILEQSVTVHFWNSLTSALIPEPESLVFKLLNQYCIRCSDAL